jgi:hypothetical protein
VHPSSSPVTKVFLLVTRNIWTHLYFEKTIELLYTKLTRDELRCNLQGPDLIFHFWILDGNEMNICKNTGIPVNYSGSFALRCLLLSPRTYFVPSTSKMSKFDVV